MRAAPAGFAECTRGFVRGHSSVSSIQRVVAGIFELGGTLAGGLPQIAPCSRPVPYYPVLYQKEIAGFLLGKRYLLVDRDPLYTTEFRTALERGGVEVVRLPARSPNLNAFAERFVLSIKSECLDRIVPLGERHLRRTVSEFVEHYHRERNHQGLEVRTTEQMGGSVSRRRSGSVSRRRQRAFAKNGPQGIRLQT